MKQYPPSQEKLRKLREQGEFPFSTDVTTGILIFIIALGILALYQFKTDIIEAFSQLFEYPNLENNSLNYSREYFYKTNILPIAILIPLCVACLIAGLTQSRFLFSSKTIFQGFNFSFRRLANLLSIKAWLTHGIIGVKWATCIVIGVTALVESSNFKKLFLLKEPIFSSVDSLSVISKYGFNIMGTIFGWLTVFAVICAAGSWFVNVLRFRGRHYMTRDEIEAEYRETELSPEVKRAILAKGRN